MSTSARAVVWVLFVLGLSAPARVRAQIDTIQAYADAIASAANPRWRGQRVPWPSVPARPNAPIAQRSSLYAIAIHSPPTDPARIDRLLAELEDFATYLDDRGWGHPSFDAMSGGSSDFDLYLVPSLETHYETSIEARDLVSYLDSASSFARVDARLDDDELVLGAARAYAEAALITLDPAEAPSWRRAIASWLVWQWCGYWPNDETVLDDAARDASRAPIDSIDRRFSVHDATPPRSDQTSSLWLALLSASIDNGHGDAICELMHFARQRTWEGYELRGAPDLWMVLETREKLADRKLEDLVEELAVQRYLAGTASPSRSPAVAAIGAPPVQPFVQTSWVELPKKSVYDESGVETLGAAYARIDTREASVGSLLRVWLAGEFGVEWKLVLLALGADDRVLTRVSTPGHDAPRAYFPLEFIAPTDHVIAIVINMSSRLPDADGDDENVHSFRVTFDRAQITP